MDHEDRSGWLATLFLGFVILFLGFVIGFSVGTFVWKKYDMREGQIKALKGEWYIRADTLDTPTVVYVKIKNK